MMYSKVTAGITISRSTFGSVRLEVSVSLTDLGNLAVGAFDLVNCSLSVVGFVPVFHVGQQVS